MHFKLPFRPAGRLLKRLCFQKSSVCYFCSLCEDRKTNLSATNNAKRSFSNAYGSLKTNLNQGKTGEELIIPKEVDILIVGGGIVGSSIAYWLKQRAPESFSLAVVERDLTYSRSSTVLSVGGIRQQFSLPENIQLSKYSAEFLRNVKKHLSVLDLDPPDISFQPHGYLFLVSESGIPQLQENHKVQKDLGSKVELLTSRQLKEKFSWLNTDGIAMGSYGLENEGWFDPWALLTAFRSKASSFGAKYLNAEVTDFEFKEMRNAPTDNEESYKSVNHVLVKGPDGEMHKIQFSMLIVAGGAYSAEIAKKLRIGTGPGFLQVPLPVEPRKRYVYVFQCENGPGLDFPLLIDKTGAYARREGLGGYYIGGKSPEESDEPDITNLDVDYNYFENSVWPLLAHRVPSFEAIKMRSAWAGFYDYNTYDQNAIIGRHPYYDNVYIVTGFSGHGIQMAPAVGRAVMEYILDGKYVTIDLTRFGFERFINEEPLFEKNIV